MPEAHSRKHRPVARVDAVIAVSMQVTLDEISAAMAAVGLTPRGRSPEEIKEADAALEKERGEVEAHELVTRAREYARLSFSVLQTIRPMLAGRCDLEGLAATDQAEELCTTVASKIFRAISSARDPEVTQDDVQSDANGSAKVALLVIEESRRAWRVLMAPRRGVANGAPARFLAMLEGLEHSLLEMFPRALQFVRPGFDTGELTGDAARLAQVLREPATLRGN